MKYGEYAIKDDLIGFRNVFLMPSRGAAERAFVQLCEDISTDIGKSPADFSLYQVAEFDDQTGDVVPVFEFIRKGVKEVD